MLRGVTACYRVLEGVTRRYYVIGYFTAVTVEQDAYSKIPKGGECNRSQIPFKCVGFRHSSLS